MTRKNLFLGVCCLLCIAGWAHAQIGTRIAPPVTGIYHCAFPNFGPAEDKVTVKRIKTFQSLTGKPIVWAYFSNNWFTGIHFPLSAVNTISSYGKIPFIRMMPRSTWNEYQPDPIYTMQAILSGQFDADLQQWFIDARDTAIPLMVEFGTEVNGAWFPWNGMWNGGSRTDLYGDPNVADGPERFRDAFRHIIALSRSVNANNITWVFHVDAGADPAEAWNSMAAYYPGDSYIDWIGISVYGAQVPSDDWPSFSEILDAAYPEFAALSPDKPMALLEFGVTGVHPYGNKATWIRNALNNIKNQRYPRIKAISWWHSMWTNDDGTVSDLRVNSSKDALKAYKAGIADPIFLGSQQ